MHPQDWISLSQFVERYPNFGPIHSLRWMIKKHHDKEFISKKGPKSTRISPSRFFEWLAKND